ncbi:hypothetical protein QX249_24820 [Vibrio parahaemolyticus]|uniref:Uncharacterized protein n=1 Tax=Vibrio parahaemolyticus TaxID=670 RepID=A0AAW8Q9A0_VIBPH|nr:hypothetical protein [Vibrio parahaemolyticus]MDS1823860.1 hypothetical protein [Vibrio parahaemolyticus]
MPNTSITTYPACIATRLDVSCDFVCVEFVIDSESSRDDERAYLT